MILLNLNEKPPDLLCPHCEQPLSDHDGLGACRQTKVSRRFFLGGLGVAAIGAASGMAFAQKAQAALEDIVVSEVVPQVVVTAAPRVHRGGFVRVAYAGNRMEENRQAVEAANRAGLPVIFQGGDRIDLFTPSEEAFKRKWLRTDHWPN